MRGAYDTALTQMYRDSQTHMSHCFHMSTFQSAPCHAGSAVRPTLMSTTQTELEWYGNTYTWSDLEEALAVLVAPSFKPSDLTGRAYTSVHKPAAWKGLNDDCVALLRALSGAHSHMQV